MTEDVRITELALLLLDTGRGHHDAFAATKGEDPEWPLWYAKYLEGRIDSYLGTGPTRSKLVQCLVDADEAHQTQRPDEPWPTFYARYLLGLGHEEVQTSNKPHKV